LAVEYKGPHIYTGAEESRSASVTVLPDGSIGQATSGKDGKKQIILMVDVDGPRIGWHDQRPTTKSEAVCSALSPECNEIGDGIEHGDATGQANDTSRTEYSPELRRYPRCCPGPPRGDAPRGRTICSPSRRVLH
jgi:hypothetical protein